MSFEDYLALRARLLHALDQLAVAYTKAGIEARSASLREIRTRLEDDTFRLMVVGEFKRGKSTLVNALLGDAILPAKVAPCTAVITEVRFGEEPEAVLFGTDGSKREVPFDRIREFVCIDEDDEGPSPWAKLELYYPLEICRNNVEIIDSPGLNEHHTRTEVALDYLPRADALVMVLSCEMALSQSELGFIDDTLGGRDLSNVFFLWNRYDAVADSPDDLDDIKRRSRRMLEPKLTAKNRIFFVSAKDALVGRRRGSPELVERSLMPVFEEVLEQFLAGERGRVKVLGPLRSAEKAARDCALQIPRMEAHLAAPLEELEKKQAALSPRISELEKKRLRVGRMLDRREAELGDLVDGRLRGYINGLEPRLRQCVQDAPSSWWEGLVNKKKVHKKHIEGLCEFLGKDFRAWQDDELTPLITRHVEGTYEALDDELRFFLKDVDAIRADLLPELEFDEDVDEASPVDRVLSTAGVAILYGIAPGLMIEGASGGIKQVMEGLGYQVASFVGVVIIGTLLGVTAPVLAPIVLVASVGMAVLRALFKTRSAMEKLQDKAVADVMVAIRDSMPVIESKAADRISLTLGELSSAIDNGMQTMIDEVQAEVATILTEKRSGEAAVKRGRQRLLEARGILGEISETLDSVRAAVDR